MNEIQKPNSHETKNTLKTPEADIATGLYAVPLDSLREDQWRDILRAYNRAANGDELKDDSDILAQFSVEDIVEARELRLGSRLSPHTKLRIRAGYNETSGEPLVSFYMDTNDPDANNSLESEVQDMNDGFREAVNEVLRPSGEAVVIE